MVTHPLQGLQHPSIRGNARYNNHQSSHMVSLRALHLHSNSSANQQPPETPEEGVTAPGTSSVAQMQQQPRSGVGDAVWTVWSGTQQFAGNVLSAWSSREASTGTAFDNNAASTSVPSSSGRAKLLKDAAERGRKVSGGTVVAACCLTCPHRHAFSSYMCGHRRNVLTQPSPLPIWSPTSSLWASWKHTTSACCPTCVR